MLLSNWGITTLTSLYTGSKALSSILHWRGEEGGERRERGGGRGEEGEGRRERGGGRGEEGEGRGERGGGRGEEGERRSDGKKRDRKAIYI